MIKFFFKIIKRIIKWTLLTVLFCIIYYFLIIPDVSILKNNHPKTSALIEARKKEAVEKGKKPKSYITWVPYKRISGNLKKAVLSAEDSAFYNHNGFDYKQIKEAVKEDIEKRQFKRGASTITQQLAKNLYLSTSKNPIRKINEAIITYKMENELSKTRILEIYLNIIEWGDGIYGAEAASRTYFKKSASALSEEQAATLAAMIINPRKYTPSSKRIQKRKNMILRRMRHW